MTPRKQARALYQAIRGRLIYPSNAEDEREAAIDIIAAALADARRAGLEEAANSGELWSFLRSVLSQGGAIQVDYSSGKHSGYEEYAARLDAAARERADEWIAKTQAAQEEAHDVP